MLVLTYMLYIYNKFFIFLVTQYLCSPWEVLCTLRITISLKSHREGEQNHTDSGGSGQAEHLDFGHREGCVELWHYLIGFTEMPHNQGLHL